MADKKVTYTSADAARAASLAKSQTAFQSMFQMQGGPLGPNQYTDPYNATTKLYLAYLEAPAANKYIKFQEIYRGLISQPSPTGKGSLWDYTKTLMGSKNKSILPDASDISKITSAIQGAVASNAPDVVAYLQQMKTVTGEGKVVAKPTTTYNKQISTALQLKDYNDAKQMVGDAYIAAYGFPMSSDLVTKFQEAFNSEAKKQVPTSTTTQVTTPVPVYDMKKPIIDPKTKKQKVDKNGKPMFARKLDENGKPAVEYVTRSTVVATGEGFTDDEQKQFLADYLATNAPDIIADPTKIGGLAKSIYDQVIALHKNNFLDTPDLPSLVPLLKSVIGTADQAVATETLRKYQSDQRAKAAVKYMGIADYLNAGKDAAEFINPLRDRVSQFLETDVGLNDPLMTQLLNFQGEDKKYRLMNDYELQQALVNDPRFAKTSTAKNQSVNAAQALASALGR